MQVEYIFLLKKESSAQERGKKRRLGRKKKEGRGRKSLKGETKIAFNEREREYSLH